MIIVRILRPKRHNNVDTNKTVLVVIYLVIAETSMNIVMDVSVT